MLRRDFQLLADRRAAEALTLYDAGHYDGAYYLGGLAIECAFKACIARQTQRFEFPDRKRATDAFTHSLVNLRTQARLAEVMDGASEPLRARWSVVKDWSVDSRYTHGVQQVDCLGYLQAAIGRDGVLPWVKRYW